MKDFVIDASTDTAENRLPPGNERNEYSLVLSFTLPTGATEAKIVALDSPAWEFLDLDEPEKQLTAGKAVATLTGAFRETGAGGVHDFKVTVSYTDSAKAAKTTTHGFRILVQSLQNVTINVSDLPSLVRTKHYRVQLTAEGGRRPYKWSQASTTILPPGLIFDPATGVLEGTVEDIGWSQQVFVFAVAVASADDAPEQQPAQRAFNIEVIEPEQVAGYITSWVQFGLAMAGILGLGKYAWETYKERDARNVDMGKEIESYLKSGDWKIGDHVVRSRMTAAEFAEGVRERAVAQQLTVDGRISSLEKAVKTMRAVEGEYNTRIAAAQTAHDAARDIVNGTTPGDQTKAAADVLEQTENIRREGEEKTRVEDGRKALEVELAEHTAERHEAHRVAK